MNADPAPVTEQSTAARTVATESSLEPTIGGIAQLAANVCQTRFASIALTSFGQTLCSTDGVLSAAVFRSDPFSNSAMHAAELFEIRDTTLDPRFIDATPNFCRHAIRFYAGLALRARNGDVLGTLAVYDGAPRQLTPGQRTVLTLLASQAVLQAELGARLQERALLSVPEFVGPRPPNDATLARALLQSAPVAIYHTDSMGNLTFVNPEYRRIFGLTPEQSVNDWAQGVHPDDRVRMENAWADFCRRPRPVRFEYRTEPVAGVIRFFAEQVVAVDGVAGFVGTISDVTDLVAARGNLQRERHFVSSALDSLPGLFYVIDEESRLLLWNRNLEALSGYLPEELSQLTITELFVDAHKRIIAETFRQVFVAGEATVEAEFVAKDKTTTPFFFTGRLAHIDQKPCLIGMGIDISARRRAEAGQRESEDRYSSLFKNMLDGFAYCKMLYDDHERPVDFVYLCVNDSFERLTGLANVVDKRATEVIPGIKELSPEVFEIYGRVASTGVPETFDIDFQPLDRWFHVSVYSPAKSHFVAVFDNITQRKAADERIRRLNRIYAVLSGINAAIVRVSGRTELLQQACNIAVEHGGFGIANTLLVDEDGGETSPGPCAGATSIPVPRASFRSGTETMSLRRTAIRAILEKKPVFSNDISVEPHTSVLRSEALRRDYGSIISLPLIVGDRVVAVLTLYGKEKNAFDAEELRLLEELAEDISFALDGIEKKAKLDYLALYDPLTGLANRALFLERMSQSIHAAGQAVGTLAIAILDIERFRTINESLGREVGDALIKQIAERLTITGGSTSVGRLSGDQFGLILATVKERSQVEQILSHAVRMCFDAPFKVTDTELRLSAKAGIVLFPDDGVDAGTLLANAEAALRKAKERGERHFLYTPVLRERTAERLTLENKLRGALERDEFVLHYQPKVDLETRRIVGLEALIRWQSPQLGLVSPGQFIPLMEETGLITDVGAWVLQRAAIDHRRWVEQGLSAPRVAVNISAIQLRQHDFVRTVEQAITQGIAPTGIDIEITESLIMGDIEGNIGKLKELRSLGMSIAVDDFGTGHSSLAYLAKLPVQALKIDRSFIITMLNNPEDMALVQTIISLAHSLRFKVIAEGVELEDQAKILRLLRCDEMQGFLFSKPVPFEETTVLLSKGDKA